MRTALTILLLLPPLSARCADSTPVGDHGFWITAGLGVPSGGAGSAAFQFGLLTERSERVYGFEYQFAAVRQRDGSGTEGVQVLRAGLGRRLNRNWLLASATVGPSLELRRDYDTWLMRHADGPWTLAPGIGAGLEVQVKPLWFAVPEIGLGLGWTGNASTAGTFQCLRASLVFHNLL